MLKSIYIFFILFFITLLLAHIILFKCMCKNSEKFNSISTKSDNVNQKTIWILWLQGWNKNTPELISEVRKSWVEFNKDWNVIALDSVNIANYLDLTSNSPISLLVESNIPPAAYSDVIRLNLLEKYGGVWVDATLLCMRPLDEWIYDALLPTGFWMYHGRDYGKGPASWFIISIRNSYIIKQWAKECMNYWKLKNYNGKPHDYFWMDELFTNLYLSDNKFLSEWNNVPYLWCDSFSQSHMIMKDGKAEKECSKITKKGLIYNPPHVIKLTRHSASVNLLSDTNTKCAIEASKERRLLLHDKFYDPSITNNRNIMINLNFTDTTGLPDITSKIGVFADCGCEFSVNFIVELCKKYNITPLIYDKCGFCKNVPDEVFCRPLLNTGRDLGTFLWFVTKYYHIIPDDTQVYFSAGNMKKHNRGERLEELFKGNFVQLGQLDSVKDFSLSEYEGSQLFRAEPPNFKEWYEKYIGEWIPNKEVVSYNALVRTTGANIRKRPLTTYINVYNELILANDNEIVHYIERAIYDLFN